MLRTRLLQISTPIGNNLSLKSYELECKGLETHPLFPLPKRKKHPGTIFEKCAKSSEKLMGSQLLS